MTNYQIIEGYKQKHNITSAIDTFAGWKRKGYNVKKGTKSEIKISIWRPKKGKPSNVSTDNTSDEEILKYFYLVNASFFTREQVEKEITA